VSLKAHQPPLINFASNALSSGGRWGNPVEHRPAVKPASCA
jgi:hypothetical protein